MNSRNPTPLDLLNVRHFKTRNGSLVAIKPQEMCTYFSGHYEDLGNDTFSSVNKANIAIKRQ